MPHHLKSLMSDLVFRQAKPEDAQIIAGLVNSAYRGDSSRAGWTTEADLIKGARTNDQDILELIELADSIILLCVQNENIIGSVHIQKNGTVGYLGLFVVSPTLQGGGIGKQFIQAAELEAKRAWGITQMTMSVITIRDELIAFYERRGYCRTGQLKPFPTDAGENVPQRKDLQLETLLKNLD